MFIESDLLETDTILTDEMIQCLGNTSSELGHWWGLQVYMKQD